MKKITLNAMTLVVAAFFGIVQFGSPTAFARTAAIARDGQNQQTQQPKVPGKSPANAALYSQPQVFLGTVTKQNGHFVLTAGQFTYKLNDQSKIKKYAGEQVQITGKLNPKTNKIKIMKIRKPSY